MTQLNDYFIAIPMRVYDVNVDSSNYTHGLPSLSGVDGFCHAFSRNVQQFLDNTYTHASFAYIISNIEYNKGIKRYVPYELADKKKINASMAHEMVAMIDQTLIIRFHSEKSLSEIYNPEKLSVALSHLRFMAGRIDCNADDITMKHFSPDNLELALSQCKRNSFIIEDASDLLESNETQGDSRWEKMLTLLSRKKSKAVNNIIRPEGYYIPTHIGYALLEEPTDKVNVRCEDTQHSYAEPVISVARCRTLASARIDLRQVKVFWSNCALNANDLKEDLYIVYGVYI